MKTSSSVYLDEPYANAIIVMAYNESYIRAYSDGKSDYERNFLAHYSDQSKMHDALHYLVLRERVLIHPYFDNFDISPLVKDGILEVPDLGPAYDPGRQWIWEEIDREGLTYPVLSILASKGLSITAADLEKRVKDGLLHDYWQQIDKYYRSEAEILVAGESSKRRKELEETKAALAERTPIFSALNRVSKIVNASKIAKGVAVWDCPTGKSENPRGDCESSDMVVAGILIDGLSGVRVRSLSDALDLRHHPAIQEFRSEFDDILEMFSIGEMNGDAIRAKVSKANRALKLAGLADVTGRVLTILGIPALAWNPASIGVTLGGVITLLGASAARRRYKWALLSNRR